MKVFMTGNLGYVGGKGLRSNSPLLSIKKAIKEINYDPQI